MSSIEQLLRSGAPTPLTDDVSVAAEAVAMARTAARLPKRPRRALLLGWWLGVGLLAVGGTAAVAAPGFVEWAKFTPDAEAQRTFYTDSGSVLGDCEVVARIMPVYRVPGVSNEEAERRTERARVHLASHDWDSVIASITADDLAAAVREERLQDPSATLFTVSGQVMAERFSEEFRRAGFEQPAVSLEIAAMCAPRESPID